MRDYELVFIIRPDLEDTAINELIEKVKGWITDAGGAIVKSDRWGKRKLAYPIRRQYEGQYVLLVTQMPPTLCNVLERNLRLTEPVIRFLITAVEQ